MATEYLPVVFWCILLFFFESGDCSAVVAEAEVLEERVAEAGEARAKGIG